MLRFALPGYAVAGAVACCLPLLLHWLRRRRLLVIRWGPMSFLLQARARATRRLRWRDPLLLILRTSALLLLGLGLAQPRLASTATHSLSAGPLHLLLLVDNSLSMGYQQGAGTLLDDAKEAARAAIQVLDARSRVTILPLCEGPTRLGTARRASPELALEQVAEIPLLDAEVRPRDVQKRVLAAANAEHDLALRLLWIGDEPPREWDQPDDSAGVGSIPALEFQPIGGGQRDNAWVADLYVQDGLADANSDALLVGTIGYSGPARREHVLVTLWVEGQPVASQTVDLEPNQTTRVGFDYRFTSSGQLDDCQFVPVSLRIEPDRLVEDDVRYLMVPVVSRLAALFIDELGPREDRTVRDLGETWPLRQLLAPEAVGPRARQHPLDVRQATLPELDSHMLEDVRLVVVGGVTPTPAQRQRLLSWVRDGGELIVTAGGQANLASWFPDRADQAATALTLEGRVRADPPSNASPPLRLDPSSLQHGDLRLELATREEFLDLVSQPEFRRVAAVELPSGSKTRVLARFSNGLPCLFVQPLENGHVTVLATSLRPTSNTLALTSAFYILDRTVRLALARTLARRTFSNVDTVRLRVDGSSRAERYQLLRPGSAVGEWLRVQSSAGQEADYDFPGVVIRRPFVRGFYSIDPDPLAVKSGRAGPLPSPDRTIVAIQGPARESRLGAALASKSRATNVVPLATGLNPDLSTYVLFLVWFLLLAELLLLAWEARRAERLRQPTSPSARYVP